MQAPWTMPGTDLSGVYKKYLLQTLKKLLGWPYALPPHMVRPYQDFREFLALSYRKNPALVLESLSGPLLGGMVHGGDLGGAVVGVALALSKAKNIGNRGFFWGQPIRVFAAPPLGKVLDPPAVGALFVDGKVELGDRGELEEEALFWPLSAGGWLGGVDCNPLALFEAHPEKSGNRLDFGGLASSSWVEALNQARALVAYAMPELAAEHAGLLKMVIPVGFHGGRSFSASYKEVIGQVYISYLEDRLSLAEALVHETQHNKLNLLSYTDRILEDGGQGLYHSPVRPDPRPLWGILLALHAYLPVAGLYKTLIDQQHSCIHDHAKQRFSEILRGNHEAAEIIKAHARPTILGKTVIEGMFMVEEQQWEWR
jgi:hypothetical protein